MSVPSKSPTPDTFILKVSELPVPGLFITLLIKNCTKGGVYEFFNNMRYYDGQENYDFVEKILDNKVSGTKIDSFEGDLMIFKGNKSIHQVTAVEEGERILVTFNYNEAEGISLSEQSRKTFFGRIK